MQDKSGDRRVRVKLEGLIRSLTVTFSITDNAS